MKKPDPFTDAESEQFINYLFHNEKYRKSLSDLISEALEEWLEKSDNHKETKSEKTK